MKPYSHRRWHCQSKLADIAKNAKRKAEGRTPTFIAPMALTAVQRIDLVDGNGAVVASIENQPGKQGSLAVYQYLEQVFDTLDAKAAEHGLVVFAEHVADALNRPGAHPNIDRLLAIAAGGTPLLIEVIATGR